MESIEKKAMKFVIEYEKGEGRNPLDVSKKRVGYDIKSNERCIEVKGQSETNNGRPKQNWLFFDTSCFKALQKESEYFVYLVFNIPKDISIEEGDPKLIIFDKEEIIRSLRTGVGFSIWSNTKRLKELEIKRKTAMQH